MLSFKVCIHILKKTTHSLHFVNRQYFNAILERDHLKLFSRIDRKVLTHLSGDNDLVFGGYSYSCHTILLSIVLSCYKKYTMPPLPVKF